MVKIAARSMRSAASRRRRAIARGDSPLDSRCASITARVIAASGESSASGSPAATRPATSRRLRIRARSSCVAASVKVTASTSPTSRRCSTTSRSTSVARVKVLPVPAEASIAWAPLSGRER